jgi:hypothetical protein
LRDAIRRPESRQARDTIQTSNQASVEQKMSRFPQNSRYAPKRTDPRFDPRRPQAVADVLDRTDAFAPLRAGVEQVAALRRDLDKLLPDYLATNVEPGFIKEGVLALFAAHNALAARLRHIEPRLLADLQQRGWAIDSLRIRVRPQPMKEPPAPKQARMSTVGATALHELAETLEPSPLQEALARMAARHQAKVQKK